MLRVGLLILLGAALAGAPRAAPAWDEPPIRWGADSEGGAPFIFKDPKNAEQNIGFEVEIAAALSRELGRPIEWKQYTFDSLVSGLQRRDIDFVMNGLEVTPDRAKNLRLSRPYYVCYLQLVTRRDETRFESLEQLKALGGSAGTMSETRSAFLLEEMGIPAKLYDGQAEPFQDLELGRTDAVLLDLPIAVYYGQPNPKLKLTGKPVSPGYYAIAMLKDQEELAQRIDRAIYRMGQSGELRRIYEKWHLWSDDQETLFRDEAGPTIDVLHESGRQWTFGIYFPLLFRSAWMTINVSLLSMAAAMLLGLPIAMCRLYGPLPIRWLAVAYVELFRGIPVLLLLYMLYYGLPLIMERLGWGVTFRPSDFTVAIVAFGLNYAAYEAEIYRAGLSAIPAGQWEAAASLGMSSMTTFRRVILPQALRIVVPPVTNDFVALFKDTSLVSVIGVVELTKQYQILSKSSLKYFEIGLTTALLYLCMSAPLGYLARRLEKAWHTHA